MSTTAREIMETSLRLISVLDPVESMSPEQGLTAFRCFNSLIDSWNAEKLLSFKINRTVFPLIVGQQQYTLGVGGDFNMTRPAGIEDMSVLLTQNTPIIELPLQIDQDEDWQRVTVKSVVSSFPLECYPDGDFPLNNLYFWPIPMAPCSVVLYTWKRIEPNVTLSSLINYPPGFERAFKFNLAIDIAPEYGLEAPPTVQKIAMNSKRRIKNLNWTPREMSLDPMFRYDTGSSVGIKSRGYVVDT